MSVLQLSQTESLYSSRGRMNPIYNFSIDFLFSLNLSPLNILILCHAVRVINLRCSDHVQFDRKVNPRCLCVSVSCIWTPLKTKEDDKGVLEGLKLS